MSANDSCAGFANLKARRIIGVILNITVFGSDPRRFQVKPSRLLPKTLPTFAQTLPTFVTSPYASRFLNRSGKYSWRWVLGYAKLAALCMRKRLWNSWC